MRPADARRQDRSRETLRRVASAPLEHLDYEETLRALQEHVGTRVTVAFGGAATEWSAGSVTGQLHAATEIDYGATLAILEYRLSGETIYFTVLNLEHPQTMGGFGIWREGFAWGRRYAGVTGPAVHFCVEGVTVRVMPIPHGMLPIDS